MVFIEADRAETSHAKRFDWDEVKAYYNGRGLRVRGRNNSGVDTDDPPFRGTLAIAQNEPVNASDAVLERIVQLHFSKSGHSNESKAATEEMQRLGTEQLSYFTLLAAIHEKEVVEHVRERMGGIKIIYSNRKALHTLAWQRITLNSLHLPKCLQKLQSSPTNSAKRPVRH